VHGASLRITQEKTVLDLPVSELETAYKVPFGRY
jgi:hypothetical protein